MTDRPVTEPNSRRTRASRSRSQRSLTSAKRLVARSNARVLASITVEIAFTDGLTPVRGDHIRASVETSLRNLGVDTIGVLQLHAWRDDWIGQGDWLEAIDELRQQGKIRFFGISINDHEAASGVRLVESGLVDTVQVIYNVFDQRLEDALLPACEERDIGVVARVPFDEGGGCANFYE